LLIKLFGGWGGGGIDYVDETAAVLHDTILHGEDGMVAAEADSAAGFEFGAALAHDNAADLGFFAAEELHAPTLAFGVATVLGRASSHFMCHMTTFLL
jgi:hypothetical protein